MARQLLLKERFRRAYDRLSPPDRERVKKSLRLLQDYVRTGEAPVGLGLKKLGPEVYEFRVGLALRGVYVEEGQDVIVSLLGSHDEVRRFLKRS